MTAVALVAAMFPGVMTPVPLAKTPVRSADPPAVTVAGFAVKLVIVGARGVTVTVTPWVAVSPIALVTVRI